MSTLKGLRPKDAPTMWPTKSVRQNDLAPGVTKTERRRPLILANEKPSSVMQKGITRGLMSRPNTKGKKGAVIIAAARWEKITTWITLSPYLAVAQMGQRT